MEYKFKVGDLVLVSNPSTPHYEDCRGHFGRIVKVNKRFPLYPYTIKFFKWKRWEDYGSDERRFFMEDELEVATEDMLMAHEI